MRVIIIGSGVAGAEAGTFLGQQTHMPLEIVEIEHEPSRRFGGWGFQGFPGTETTNLAARKMYLGKDPEEILRWLVDPLVRRTWPEQFRSMTFSPDRPIPRGLVQRYIAWRRAQVANSLATYKHVTGEAVDVQVNDDDTSVTVTLRSGECIHGDRLVMASGSIAVKVPAYLKDWQDHNRIIIDPLTIEGHRRRHELPVDARVLILGTGLTGEEQANLLYSDGHKELILMSRGGHRHFTYREDQTNVPLVLDSPPAFLLEDTPEGFNTKMTELFKHYTSRGHSQEDIFDAIRPHWGEVCRQLGGNDQAAAMLHRFRRPLAVNSIGASHQVAALLKKAESDGSLQVLRGYIDSVVETDDGFVVNYKDTLEAEEASTLEIDFIINAIGRNIIRHPLWQGLLDKGIASKHPGIGVQVTARGQMLDAQGQASSRIWVVGMARAGDHALRHGFLGNTAFNVPQVRAHLYDTINFMLHDMECPPSNIDEVLARLSTEGPNARLSDGDAPLIWAVSEDYATIAYALIAAQAALDARNPLGNTALIRAASEGRVDLTKALIKAGANLDIQNNDGYTAVMIARRRGHEDIVAVLLEAGANQEIKNKWGRSLQDPGYNPRRLPVTPRNYALASQVLEAISSSV